MRRKRGRYAFRIFTWVLLAAVLMSGCGGSEGTGQRQIASVENPVETEDAGEREKKETSVEDGNDAGEAVAMGRFVERAADLSDRLSGEGNRLFLRQDGGLLITDQTRDFVVSEDGGETWETEREEWHGRLLDEGAYILDMAYGADRMAAVIIKDEGEAGEFSSRMIIRKPDGSEIFAELSLTGEENYIRKVWITDNGRIFAADCGNLLYEVEEDGSGRQFLALEEGRAELLTLEGTCLILDGHGFGRLVIYDMERKEFVEDPVLDQFVRENYGDRSFFGDNGYDLFFFQGEEGVLYLAGKKGLHRHVMNGSAVEQVIDGSLGSFADPGCNVLGMTMTKGNEFLALFTGGKAVRFLYDPDIPTVPAGKIKVYSLKDNDTVRRAISLYQSADAENYVEYEVGMDGSDSLTRQDAVKKLNTKLMAGEGPDLIVLDGLPLDSYVEKGMLMDLGSALREKGLDNKIFPNILEAFDRDGGIYYLPCEISFPVAQGGAPYIEEMEDLEGMAWAMEELRKNNPGQDLIEIYSPGGIMRFLAKTCAPSWKTKEGAFDKEAAAAFLSASKRIYDAQLDGLPDEVMERYVRWNEETIAYTGRGREEVDSFKDYVDAAGLVSGRSAVLLGTLESAFGYAEMISVLKAEGFEDMRMRPLSGLSGNVFLSETLVGINASSPKTKQAADLLAVLLGEEIKTGSGLAVNRDAFEESLLPDMTYYREGEPYMTTGGSDEDGKMYSLSVYWMDEAQKDILRGWMEEADTPYIPDPVLEEAVFEEGEAYLRGERSLQEVMEAVERKVGVLMAE